MMANVLIKSKHLASIKQSRTDFGSTIGSITPLATALTAVRVSWW